MGMIVSSFLAEVDGRIFRTMVPQSGEVRVYARAVPPLPMYWIVV